MREWNRYKDGGGEKSSRMEGETDIKLRLLLLMRVGMKSEWGSLRDGQSQLEVRIYMSFTQRYGISDIIPAMSADSSASIILYCKVEELTARMYTVGWLADRLWAARETNLFLYCTV